MCLIQTGYNASSFCGVSLACPVPWPRYNSSRRISSHPRAWHAARPRPFLHRLTLPCPSQPHIDMCWTIVLWPDHKQTILTSFSFWDLAEIIFSKWAALIYFPLSDYCSSLNTIVSTINKLLWARRSFCTNNESPSLFHPSISVVNCHTKTPILHMHKIHCCSVIAECACTEMPVCV